MGKKVIGPAIDGCCGHNVVILMAKGLDGIADGRRPRCGHKCSHAAFQCSKAFFKDIACWIPQPAVNETSILQGKTVRCLGRILTDVGCTHVNRYGTGPGRWVRLFLPYMELQCFKMIRFSFTHHNTPYSQFIVLKYELIIGGTK